MEKDDFLLLVTKKFTGNISAEEEAFLEEALQTDEFYRIEYMYLEDFLSEEKVLPTEIQQQLEKTWSAIEKKNSDKFFEISSVLPDTKILSFSKILKIASVIILFAAGAAYLFTQVSKKTLQAPTEISTILNKQTSDTGRSFLLLPDGTKVWLNHSSRIDYNKNFGSSKREITLTGEAFFDVAKNEKIPLIIHAQNIDIKVKGTAFNVSAYYKNRFVETSLLRGLVEVVDKNKPDKAILLRPNEKLVIPREPGIEFQNNNSKFDSVSNSSKRPYAIESLNREPSTLLLPETAWIENKLIFYKASFDAVASKMESWYGVEINNENVELRSQKFSGVFDTETLQQALSALKLSYPFHFSIHNKTVTITK
jgi:transmembrane sensor